MKIRRKMPTTPTERHETVRDEIVSLLSRETLTARELSEQVRVRESEVLEHLEHIRSTLRGRLVQEPATCLACGFVFRKRARVKGPGRCPVCKSEHISEPRFSVV